MIWASQDHVTHTKNKYARKLIAKCCAVRLLQQSVTPNTLVPCSHLLFFSHAPFCDCSSGETSLPPTRSLAGTSLAPGQALMRGPAQKEGGGERHRRRVTRGAGQAESARSSLRSGPSLPALMRSVREEETLRLPKSEHSQGTCGSKGCSKRRELYEIYSTDNLS